ncbi:MAG: prepilin peptidase [Bacilli bacterium]|nr:prepilin peptidase [Bacilli bacterium]
MVVLFVIIGMCLASFYMVLATRMPNKESIVKGRSHCDSCKHELKYYDLIPVVSFILLKGKCRYCHKKIPVLTVLVEIIMGLLFGAGYYLYGFSYELYAYLIIVSLLVIIFISDFKYLVILDSPLLIGTILIIALKFVYFGYVAGIRSLASAVLLFFFFLLVKLIGDRIFKRESLGWGDVKFSAFMGAVLGIRLGLTSLVIGSLLAMPYALYYISKKEEKEIPYGPFLIAGVFITFVFMDKINYLIDLLLLVN